MTGFLEGTDATLLEKRMGWWDTAARYQLVHAAAIVSLLSALGSRARPAAIAMVAGVSVFSGTLYVMGAGGPRWLGAITPIGGTLLLVGWLLAMSAVPGPSSSEQQPQ